MILTDWLEKIKQNDQPLTFVSFLLLTNLLAFGLGRLTIVSGGEEPILVDFQAQTAQVIESEKITKVGPRAPLTTGVNVKGSVVASKNGTKFHLPTCPGAKQIKEANKITFPSASAALAAGYTPAANCPELK